MNELVIFGMQWGAVVSEIKLGVEWFGGFWVSE